MTFSFKTIACGTCAALTAGIVMFGATAGHAAEIDIKYRQSLMKAVGGHMGAISSILKGGSASMDNLAMHAAAMADLSKMAPDAFPEGSGPMDGETGALPAIWEKPDEFKVVLAAFASEASKLAEVAKGGDKGAVGAQLGELGKNACKACHDDFRMKK